MEVTDFYLAVIIGLTLSLLFTEILGIIPGGIIVPGYMALIFDSPKTVATIYLISFVIYAITKYIFPKFTVLYGRRRFVALIVLSVIFKLLFELVFPVMPFAIFEIRGIGAIMPALIANCYYKQGIKLTVISSLVLSAVTFGILQLIFIL